MAKAKRQPEGFESNSTSLGIWAALIKELGIPSFMVLFFVFCFLGFASPAQKSEFIDKYFLLKGINDNPFPFSFILLILLFIIILQYVYYKKELQLHKNEVNRMAQEKSQLQEKILEKKMTSSR
jgi:hypothetical protein